MKYGELTLGQMEAIVNKLGGMDGVKRFLSGKMVTMPTLPTWKTIKLGTHKNINSLRNALEAAGKKVRDRWTNDIFGKMSLSKKETEIDLAKVTVAELGFKDGAKYKDIVACAKGFGLDHCPAEGGSQLRLQYNDQPYGEWLRIAMEPIVDSSGDLGIFRVAQDGDGSWLDWSDGDPEGFWYGHDVFVFARRK